MARITGEFDGYTYTYEASWEHALDQRLLWSAMVRNAEGVMCGTPSGSIHVLGAASEQANESAVRQAVEGAIRDSVGVEREQED